ncbi:hypothetical protein [Streptomyces sp. NPDC058955]|uniref:hypothetical protein n=1 Tax=unclassified Streptomyces TaxID=2593676 RepID=UPI003662538C
MTTPSHHVHGLTRADINGQPAWALVGEGALATLASNRIATSELDTLPLDAQEHEALVEHVMDALQYYGGCRRTTPGGAGWLYVQHVPVRRLVAHVVCKLMALSAWEPFRAAPGPLRIAPHEGLVGLRESSSREYRAYTVTWSGIAYLLGAAALYNPFRTAQLGSLHSARVDSRVPSPPPSALPRTGVVALSWSSRHAATLLPVLEDLAGSGRTSLLVDLATDPAQRCDTPAVEGIRLVTPPAGLFALSGAVEHLQLWDDEHVVQVGEHVVRLSRLVRLLAVLLETSSGCTQPSWRSVVRLETWLRGVLQASRPHTLLVSNDTSPVGALAVHLADLHGVNTVHVQHGAWTAESVAWPALHSRDIVVMGDRDAPLAKAWARHPDAQVHVLGQPRFDTLAGLGRESQRQYLEKLLVPGSGRSRDRIMVWACQPFRPDRLKAHADLLLDGMWNAEGEWGLVIAPHPAQSPEAFASLMQRDGRPLVAVADPQVGARGCLAGADVVASAYSTCSVEAALLGVPVLEIGTADERTLGLAAHGLARRCTTAGDVADALSAPLRPLKAAEPASTDAVCRWSGDSAALVAQLIVSRASGHQPEHLRNEGVSAQ